MASDPSIVIVGSGPTAVHFAQTALEMGRRVLMIDIGYGPPAMARPEASLNQLKAELDDPVGYFLGDDWGSLVLPSDGSEYYGFPPSKGYVFRGIDGQELQCDGFAPLSSYAAGGLAQAWTGGCYPFSDGELADFPIGWADMEPAYSEVARRIGVSGTTSDDLTPFMPAHDGLQAPIVLDRHSQDLLEAYSRKRAGLNDRHGFFLGRARLASLSAAHDGRPGCSTCGRCLWGCPTGSLYTPSITLERLRRHPDFTYVGGERVEHFRYDDANRVTHVVTRRLAGGEATTREVDELVLAAGALGSTRILLESLARRGVNIELGGLMDNRQVLMPFVNLRRIGQPFEDRSYQYNQLAVGVPGERPFDYVHGLLTTLTTGLIHPISQSLPVGMRTATTLFRNIHGGLGLMNINFPDTRRESNRVGLELSADGRTSRMLIVYRPDSAEPERLKPMLGRFRRFLLALGCVAPPNMTRLRPMGASVHYAGTLPMIADGGDFTTDRAGRCRPFENLIVADGATFPALPAKNLTFTLMANATRIAREALAR